MVRTLTLAMLFGLLAACGTHRGGTTTTTTLPAAGGQQVVIPEGTAAAPRGDVRHRISGRVTDVERKDGEITVRSGDGAKVKLQLPPVAAATIREGDDVSVDVVVTPRR